MITRRGFLRDLVRYSALCAGAPTTATGGILWTRLAPRPLEPEGGGMDGQRTVVDWIVAEDESLARVVQRGRATAAPELAYSVHVEVDALAPDRWYFYRFTAGDAASPVGRLRTAPAEGAASPLRFAFASCQHYEQGLYTAYQHLAQEDLDLVVHLGDYIYEYGPAPGRVRRHASAEVRTLDDYRQRYAQYQADPLLRAAHQRCSWIVTWDDHEVDNNYAGLVGENGMESEEQMRQRRAAAYQAWWEHQPVRVPRAASWADLTIRRSLAWGALARFWVLDTRQYRSDQACGDGVRQVPCGDWADPSRSLLGEAQEQWLRGGLSTSRARWQVLAQQTMMAPFDSAPGDPVELAMDPWSGYPVARDRLLHTIAERAPGRTVVLTGDIHSHWVNDLAQAFDRPDRPVVATEFVGSSISSGGDGVDEWPQFARARGENPHVKWHNARRGYVRCDVTETEWRAEYRTVPFVSRPDAPVETPARWHLTHGRPGVERV